MKKKSPWRKIKGKWVNLNELSKKAGTPRAEACNENAQTYNWQRTNKQLKTKRTK